MKQGICLLLSLGCSAFGAIALFPASAQVTPDGTTNTNVDANGNDFTINQGDRAGGNLFHSFRDFSVPNGGSAFFDNAADIVNIFSRVTGGSISNIDGLLRANGSANLFLINPAGIIFGSGARLDIGGSFYGSSADSILFDDGEFSATDLENPPLLTVNAPIGLSFRDEPGDIVNRSNFGLRETSLDEQLGQEFTIRESTGLQVDSGETIALIGGDVIFNNAGAITAPGGRVELGGLSSAGEITFNPDGSLNYPEGIARGNVTLTEQSRVNVTSGGGGFINVNAKNLELSDKSELFAGIAENMGSVNAQAGDITINATESVRLIGSGGIDSNPYVFQINDYDTAIRNFVGLRPNDPNDPNLGRNPKLSSTAIGNAGGININTNLLQISDRAAIIAKTYGQGNTGNITVSASNIELNGGDFLNQVRKGAVGNAGNIDIETIFLSAQNLAFINSDTEGTGNAGNITINAGERVLFDGNNNSDFGITQLNVQVQKDARGNGGNIQINTQNFSLLGGSRIFADTNGQGNAGNVAIVADENITIASTSEIYSTVEEFGTGNAGNITINTQTLNINNGSIFSFTRGVGNAGNITIDASEVALSGDSNNSDDIINQLNIQVRDNATGNGGNLEINTSNLSLTGNFSVFADTSGNGNGGNVTINADNISLTGGSEIYANTSGVGDAGNISLNTQTLDIQNGSIFSLTSGEGDAGDITIEASEVVTLDGSNDPAPTTTQLNVQTEDGAEGNGGTITIDTKSLFLGGNSLISAATTSGEGGNITFNIDSNLTLDDGSQISAKAFNNANGGNIDINAGFIIAFPDQNNDIVANAQQGEGGNITINADSVFGIQERSANALTNDIDVSSQFGLDGTVSIITPDVDAFDNARELPTNLINSQQTVAEACRSDRSDGKPSGLIVKGRGGIPAQPIEPFNADAILVDGSISNSNSQSQHPEIKPIKTSIGDIYPARGVIVKENGDVILTAYPTDGIDRRTPDIRANCS